MGIPDEELYKILLENQYVTEENLKKAKETADEEGVSLYDVILRKDFILEEQLVQLIADYLKLSYISFSNISIISETLQTLPEAFARKQKIVVFKKDDGGVSVAVSDPSNFGAIDFVRKKTGRPVTVYLTTKHDIEDALVLYTKDIHEALESIISENIKKANSNKITGEQEPPIIELVSTLLTYAYQNKASDVHIEPEKKVSIVRFRIDGVLHDIVKLPLEIYPQIVARIKVLAKLRTDEHQIPQDGKIQFTTEAETLDIRVSIVPITTGEKVVMRLLSEHARQFSLKNLGFSDQDLAKVNDAYQKPYGMLLATGPTGSGKTTTMYAILKLLNERNTNIMTIEDPVEYEIEGVNQIQVNVKANLTFAKGLRSILRQDPNIILVGEVRDEETAGIAINSAMTGHLVLSTLHTNDAATAVPRLLDMGIEPFLVASTITIIIAQRLVRKIHAHCRISEEINVKDIEKLLDSKLLKKIFEGKQTVRLYKGKGCQLCHNTGFEGRVGVFEVLIMDEDVRQAIVDRKDAGVIQKIAIKNGMQTMIEDGIGKVMAGETTIEEVLRVTKE